MVARVIVTRPEREAQRWVRDLRLRGLEALALPLIVIGSAPQPEPLRHAWERLDQFRAVMFVSGNAVDHFFRNSTPETLAQWVQGAINTVAWANGPSTREALLQAGLAPAQIHAPDAHAAQFDSEALWQLVAGQTLERGRVLIVRGGDAHGLGGGRDWLADQLVVAGMQVELVVAYVRSPSTLTLVQRAQAQHAATDGSIWFFSSSQAISNLCELLDGQRWGAARAVTTHPRIAQAAREAGFGVVCESRPTLDAVVASIESAA